MIGKTFIKKYIFTFTGFLLSLLILLLTHLFDFDLFENLEIILERLEIYEVDEIIVSLLVFVTFVVFDLFRLQRIQKIDSEKIKIYRAMVMSTNHILNNFLNEMQFFKVTAEDTPGFDPEVLSLYDQIIDESARQIEALGKITSINEESIVAIIATQEWKDRNPEQKESLKGKK